MVADGRKEAGAAGKKSSERRRQWRAAARSLLRAGQGEGERASAGARLAGGKEAGAVGRTWWPTRVRPPRRMRTMWRPNAAGVPRCCGAAVHTRGRDAGASRGDARAGWASFSQRAESEAAAC